MIHIDAIVTRADFPHTRYRLITQPREGGLGLGAITAVLRRVEWDSDEAEWVFAPDSINFYAPAKWTIVPVGKR